jgi:integrase
MRLTDASLRALTCARGRGEQVFFDSTLPGFGCRVRSTGQKTLLLQYSIYGRAKRIYLGPPTLLTEARAAAKKLKAQIALGEDPQSERVTRKAESAATMASKLPSFLARQAARLRPNSMAGQLRHLQKHCRPLHQLPLAAIDRRTVANLLAEVTKNSGPTEAVHVRSSLSKFLGWAVAEGYLDINVAGFTNKPVEKGPRTRVPSMDELASILRACGDGQLGTATRLLAFTACRRTEIGALTWDEIDFENALITLPGSRTKNGKPHIVPLSVQALAILQQRRLQTSEPTVFGRSAAGYRNWHRGKRELDARLAAAGVELAHWTFHDLRRCFSTYLNEEGVTPPHVIEQILGHTVKGIAAVYNRARLIDERRRALQRWADVLTAAATGEKPQARVHTLRRSR